jgi:hypothetical protein
MQPARHCMQRTRFAQKQGITQRQLRFVEYGDGDVAGGGPCFDLSEPLQGERMQCVF